MLTVLWEEFIGGLLASCPFEFGESEFELAKELADLTSGGFDALIQHAYGGRSLFLEPLEVLLDCRSDPFLQFPYSHPKLVQLCVRRFEIPVD